MTDISDPSGAHRKDRRAARKTVDDAYASGRISAVDRALRVEQIEAAATRGDLAMVLRDLAGPAPEQRRPPTPPPIGSGPASSPDRTSSTPPSSGDQPDLTSSQAALWERLQREHAASQASDQPSSGTTPPPSAGLPRTGGYQPASDTLEPGKPNRRLIGCLVAFVAVVFLGPCLIAILIFGVAAVTGDWDTGSSSDPVYLDDETLDGPLFVLSEPQAWDWMRDDLEVEVGTSEVVWLEADDSGAEAAVMTDGTATRWEYDGVSWIEGDEVAVDEDTVVDLSEVDGETITGLVETARRDLDVDPDAAATVRVTASLAGPAAAVGFPDEPGTPVRAYMLDGVAS